MSPHTQKAFCGVIASNRARVKKPWSRQSWRQSAVRQKDLSLFSRHLLLSLYHHAIDDSLYNQWRRLLPLSAHFVKDSRIFLICSFSLASSFDNNTTHFRNSFNLYLHYPNNKSTKSFDVKEDVTRWMKQKNLPRSRTRSKTRCERNECQIRSNQCEISHHILSKSVTSTTHHT